MDNSSEHNSGMQPLSDPMQNIQILAIKDLECHFTWCPDEESTKLNLNDVIQKTEKKIEREPHLKVAYLTTLAYLHTRTQVKKLNEASRLLKEALDIDEQIRKDKAEDQQISSEFVIRADMLRLKQISRGKKRLTKQDAAEDAADLERLNALWRDDGNRARAYGVKGVTHNCFGPMKYAVGAAAYAEASKLQPDNFYWVYGEAVLRARCDRQQFKKAADSHHLELWVKACKIGDPLKLTDAEFYSHYAEAILCNNEQAQLCLEMADKSVKMLMAMTDMQKEKSHIVFIICLKVYRKLQKQHRMKNETRRKELTQEAKRVAACIKDPGFYLEISNEVNSPKEKIELLEKGKELAGEPGNHWIDLRLIDLQARKWGKDKTLDAFNSLRETHFCYNKNVAVIEFDKALYLLTMGNVSDAAGSCIYADQVDPSLHQVSTYKKKDFFEKLSRIAKKQNKFQEYVAWCADNFACCGSQLNIEALYIEALNDNASNDFALEHLGRFYLKRQKFDQATNCAKKLPEDHESRNKLLAEALLRNPASDIDDLTQCLKCGCKDAAVKILDILENRKSVEKTAQRVLDDVLRQPGTGKHQLFFARDTYELCARIDIVMQHEDSFFIAQELNDTSDEFLQNIKTRTCSFLELNRLMSKESLQLPAVGCDADRGNLMRSNRLEATINKLKASESNERDLSNLVVSVLKESKEVLDRSLAALLSALMCNNTHEFSYIHAFNLMKNELGGDFKKQFNSKTSEADKKKLEAEFMVSWLKQQSEHDLREKVEKYLQTAFGKRGIHFHQKSDTRDLFNFLVNREHRILSSEHFWIIRWIYPVNNEKHEAEMLVNELNDQLRSDWSGVGDCLTAYDVAHLAAEFAEETWAVLSSCAKVMLQKRLLAQWLKEFENFDYE